MSDRIFDFSECSDVGAEGETILARYLEAAGYKVKPIGQKNGHWPADVERIYDAPDMLVLSHVSGASRDVKPLVGSTLEVKADSLAHKTGNAVIELQSNVGTGRQGWVYTSKADFIAWVHLGNDRIIIARTEAIREALKGWQKNLKVIQQLNPLFTSTAMLVPIKSLLDIAFHSGIAK